MPQVNFTEIPQYHNPTKNIRQQTDRKTRNTSNNACNTALKILAVIILITAIANFPPIGIIPILYLLSENK